VIWLNEKITKAVRGKGETEMRHGRIKARKKETMGTRGERSPALEANERKLR